MNRYDKISCVTKVSEATDLLVDSLTYCSDEHIRNLLDLEIIVLTGAMKEILNLKVDD